MTPNGSTTARPSTPLEALQSTRSGGDDAHAGPDRWMHALGLGVILLGIALRVFASIRLPFDQDELYTLAESRDLFHTTLPPGIDSRPLYYLLQHPLLSILPASAVALRLLPLLFSGIGLWVTWRLGRRYLGAAGALAVVSIAALSPWYLYASTTARYYALVYLCAALVILWLPDAYSLGRPRLYLASLAAFVVGSLTHPSFVIAMVGIVFGLSLTRQDHRFGWRWPSWTAWRFLWGPYLAILIAEFIILRAVGRGSAMVNLGSRGIAATVRLVPAMIDWMTIPVFLGALLGAGLIVRRRHELRLIGGMALSGVAIGFTLLVVASTRTGVYADYGIGLLPLLFLCAGAFTLLAAGERSAVRGLAILGLVLGSALPSTVSFLSDGMRFDYRPAYQEIVTRNARRAVLGWPDVLRRYYGRGLHGYELKPDSTYLDAILQREGEAWAVVSVKRYGIVEDDAGQLSAWLSNRCRLDHSYTRPRFDMRVYRVDLYRCEWPGSDPGLIAGQARGRGA